jgi:hypothetical protein
VYAAFLAPEGTSPGREPPFGLLDRVSCHELCGNVVEYQPHLRTQSSITASRSLRGYFRQQVAESTHLCGLSRHAVLAQCPQSACRINNFESEWIVTPQLQLGKAVL